MVRINDVFYSNVSVDSKNKENRVKYFQKKNVASTIFRMKQETFLITFLNNELIVIHFVKMYFTFSERREMK